MSEIKSLNVSNQYRTRSGVTVTIVRRVEGTPFCFLGRDPKGRLHSYRPNGRYTMMEVDHPMDIVNV